MDNAVLTQITEAGTGSMSLNGDIVFASGDFYVIENCGSDCHVLIKEDNPPENTTNYAMERVDLGPASPPLPDFTTSK